MPVTGERSAIVAPVRLPAALEAMRRACVAHARLGVPPHVTLLFPFVPPSSIDLAVIDRAAAAIGRAPAFDVEFREVTHWDDGPGSERVVWLPPEPAAPFLALTDALVRAFPGYLPYGGIHDEVIPHLTLANEDVDVSATEAEACRRLPFRRRVSSAALLVEGADGRWRTLRRLSLGAPVS